MCPRALLLLALLASGACGALKGCESSTDTGLHRFSISMVLQQLLVILKKLMLEGKAENDIPVLDPLYLDRIQTAMRKKIITFDVDMQNVTIEGLAGYELIQSSFNQTDLSVTLGLYFPSIVIRADMYELHGSVYNVIPLAGYGPLRFEISGVKVSGDVRLVQSQDTKSVLIKEIQNPYYNIDQVKSITRYDGIIDGILNHMIEDLAADFANRVRALAAPALAATFVDFINPILSQYESWKFIAILI